MYIIATRFDVSIESILDTL
ncbi:hypothetical protein LJE72_25910 [Desulfosporosinus sp. SRJS8]|nr:hypothetical protein [Desulfosporosinus sp. SRJS8]